MTVYITQKSTSKDFTSARVFGNLKYLIGINRAVYPDNAETRVDEIIGIVRRRLSLFDPKRDFLLLAGHPIVVAISAIVVSDLHSIIPILHWDQQSQTYYPITLNVDIGTEVQNMEPYYEPST